MEGEGKTRRRVLAAGGIASVLGLSGCLRLSEAEPTGTATSATAATTATTTGDQSATETDTTTATETETDTATESETEPTESDDEATYPPGVSEDGVTEVLVLEHRQLTSGRSRTVETEYMGFSRRTARFSGDGRVSVESSRGPETYVENGQLFQRSRLGGEEIYAYNDSLRFELRPTALAGVDVLEALFRGGNFAPVGRQTRDGQTLFILEADAVENTSVLEETRLVNRYFRESEFPIESLSASALVTPDGLVVEMEAYLQGNGDGGEFVVNTSDVGSTSVSPPTWKATAKREEAQFETSLSSDGTYVELRQTSGQAIGSVTDVDFEIDAYDGRDYYNGRYQGSTNSGTTFYLYKTDETTEYGSPELGISKGSPPSTDPAGTWSSDTGVNLHAGELRIIDTRDVA
jgi:hypothetical protein